MFGLAAKWKARRRNRLDRLAQAIEAIGARDLQMVDEAARVDELRRRGVAELYRICRTFVGALNGKLSAPVLLLDPADYSAANYNDAGPNLFQINLRGRLLQLAFEATGELYSTEDFTLPYVLHGAVRSFNQDRLDRHTVEEQGIYYCPAGDNAHWYYFDRRTWRTGRVNEDFLAAEMERLI